MIVKKKIILFIICSVLISTWLVRFIYINKVSENPKLEEYAMGDIVSYDDNFFYLSRENRSGYKIQVTSAELIKYEDFAEKHGLALPPQPTDSSYFFTPDYVYDVVATIFNENNLEGGIDMFNTLLVTSNVRFRVNDALWCHLYPQLANSLTFKLRVNTSMEFHFPFAAEIESDQSITDFEYLNTAQFYLVISQYPIKKMIKVDLNE